ncbi:hypothetical protein SVOphi44_10 [Psuedomonas phage SVOphi44]
MQAKAKCKVKLGDVVTLCTGPAGHLERPARRHVGLAATVVDLHFEFGHWIVEYEGWDSERYTDYRDRCDESCVEKLL